MLYLAQAAQQDPLRLDPVELVIGLICFFIIFGALGKILLPRITKTLAERTDKIEGGLQKAEEAQAEANRLLEQYRAQLADARHEAARLREEAKEQGAQILADLKAQGEAEKRRIIDAAQAQLEAERRQTVTALRAEVGTLAVELASRVVGEALSDDERLERTVENFLAGLETAAGEQDATVSR